MSGEDRNSRLKDVVRKGGPMEYMMIVKGGMAAGLSNSQCKHGITDLERRSEFIIMSGLYDLKENKERLEENVREKGAFAGSQNPMYVRELAIMACNKKNDNPVTEITELKNLIIERQKATEIAKTEKNKVAEELHRKQNVDYLVSHEGRTRKEAERTYEWYIPGIRQPPMKSEQDMKIEAENVVKRIMAGTISEERIAEALTVKDTWGAYDLNFG